jgi:hypothetical protein
VRGAWLTAFEFVGLRLTFVGWRALSGRRVVIGAACAGSIHCAHDDGAARTARSWRDYALFVVLVGPNVALLLVFIYRPLADVRPNCVLVQR